jgi:surfeit locus 1 family protein
MIDRFRAAGLVWPTAFAIAALALLVGLGSWQMSRKTWKDGLITQIRERTAAPPQRIEIGRGAVRDVPEYTRVEAAGRFDHAREQLLYAVDSRSGPGYHVYVPLLAEDGLAASGGCMPFVIVNRGFVPEALKAPERRREGQVAGVVRVVGLARHSEIPSVFTPANDPARRLWFWRDLDGMATAFGAGDARCRGDVPPFSIDAEVKPANPGGWPRGGTTNLDLPNRHLEYAVTWYGLAATLVGVWLAFAVGRWRAALIPG